MDNHTFYIVDVFAEEKYAGNQLAVVIGAESFSDNCMQKIANEMHFSETTFVHSISNPDGAYRVRIFTPKSEVPFAGHPTLGTAYIIRRFLRPDCVDGLSLSLKSGVIPVTFDRRKGSETVWMKQSPPVFGKTFDIVELQSLLRLEASDFDLKFPIQEVSMGLPFIIVPLRSLDAVKRAKIERNLLPGILKKTQAGILLFCSETYQKKNDLNVRVFVDAFGIPEDPATGSGNGCLAAYISRYQFFGSSKVNVRIEQGYEIQRPSLLLADAKCVGDQIQVCVGGRVILIAKGELI